MNIDYKLIGNRALGSTELFLKKHGPLLLTSAGIAGFGVTVVLAGKAVLKAQEPIKKFKIKNEDISTSPLTETFTRTDQASETGRLWLIEGYGIAKIFAPAAGAGLVSVACIVLSHGIMRKQQTALVAAYAALDQGFRAYRRRVIEEIGEEKERELFQRPPRKIESVDAEGLPCEIDDPSDVISVPYGKYFDEYNTNWEKTAEYNLTFLMSIQMWANDRLRSRGYLFLNEVYEELGMDWTQAGQIVGWKRYGDGDGYVDFGLRVDDDEAKRSFINGKARSVFVDFNVDGPILFD